MAHTEMSRDVVIKKLDSARTLLAEAQTIQQTKAVVDMANAAEIYAKRQQLGEEAISYAHDIKLEALRLLGQMLKATPRNKGAGQPGVGRAGKNAVPKENHNIPTLAELGLDKKTSMLAQRVANLPDAKFKQVQSSVVALSKMTQPIRGTQGTGENEWYTPASYLKAVRKVLGRIDLDPASSEQANRTIGATAFYTLADDGLTKPWKGRIWLNPPYAQPLLGQFITKLVDEVQAGRTSAAVLLTHNYTDTQWFHRAASVASALCLVCGRIAFLDPHGKEAAPTQGQIFQYFGPDVDGFATHFAQHGLILVHP